jgi:ubiquinone/menaquinone biosynthesis C-methylase UbiE
MQILSSEEAKRIADAYERRSKSLRQGVYSLFDPSHLLRLQEVERRILKAIKRETRDLRDTKLLEIGCGSGYWLRQFVQWGGRPPNLVGVDLLADRVAMARELCPSDIRLECRDASSLGFRDDTFDIVFQATVFSSILDADMKAAVAREMLRVLQPGGFVLWYDFFVNNPRNPDVRGIGKKELCQLFPNCSIHCERITLAPPLGRPLSRLSAFAYNLTSALRFTCTHYLVVIKK